MPFSLPHTPILERFNATGHIESLLLDGQRHYFGHDPVTDRILSPLIQDPLEMAQFAVQWMRGHAGPRDAASWLTEVQAAPTAPTGGRRLCWWKNAT